MFATKTEQPKKPAGMLVRDPMAVIPVLPTNIEQKQDSRGLLHLRQTLPLKGFRKRVAGWLNHDYSRKLDLDEYGSLYFSLVDGRRSVREIADAMHAKLGRTRKEVDRSVVLFTKTLMTRGMIVLQVTPDNQVEATQ